MASDQSFSPFKIYIHSEVKSKVLRKCTYMTGIILYGSNNKYQKDTNYRKGNHGEYFIYLYINILFSSSNLYYI